MTVQSTETRHSYYPGAAMAQEALTGIIWLAAADLVVTRTLANGTTTTLALDDDYQLGGDGTNAAGWIKALGTEDAGTIYRITRETTLTQNRQFPKFQPINASEIEAGLDRAMLAAQELRNDQQDLENRALRVPPGETIAEMPTKLERQNTLQGFDVNGDPISVSLGTPFISNLGNIVSAGLDIMTTGTTSDLQSNLTPFLQQAMEDVSNYGGGAILFPGKGYVFQCGGDPITFGDWTYILSGQANVQTMPFNRGLIEIQNNVTLRGNGAKLMLAPGYTCPPPLFFNPFWLGKQKYGFHLEGLELDGNLANQIILPINGDSPYPPWLHGNGVTHIGVKALSARRCVFRNWRGMGLGGGPAPEYGLLGGDYLAEHCEFTDNFNGSIQWSGHRMRLLHNWHHGSGGWTGLVDIEVESETAGFDMIDIWSIGETYDARDGYAPTESFNKTIGSFTGLASDSDAAKAMNVHFRRGLTLSGNYGDTSMPEPRAFNGQKRNISIIHPKCWQANISTGGCGQVFIDSPTIELTYEANAAYMYPQDLNAISASPANNLNSGTGLTEFKVRDATIHNDMPAYGFFAGGYEWVEFSGTITGGRSAGIRLEACSGKIDARILNIGGIDTEGSSDYVGNQTSGVVIWGPKGPTDITIRAADTRGAGALMKYAVLVNGSAAALVNTTIMSLSGMLAGNVREVVENTTVTLDRSTITPKLNQKLVLSAGLEVHGATDIFADTGDSSLNLHASEGHLNKISFFNGSAYTGQIMQRADGGIQFNLVGNSGSVTPIQMNGDGSVLMTLTYDKPLQVPEAGYLWLSATDVLRTKVTKPSSDGDGVVVGSQS